ncbi:DUF5671 domain-containing protein [Sinomonas flava]|uniref:DUF5671 domain-containing protein n=1 Tax=Sinomonas flava TaxID=496857 RepID=A0ABN3BPA9_9MICC
MSSALPAVRRLILYVLLFALVVIAASGLSGLVTRTLPSGQVLAGEATAGLAQSLAFTVIGVPLAALLWWFVWRRLADPEERRSTAWDLYVAGLYSVALVVASTQLLALLAGLVEGRTEGWNGFLATAVVWAGVLAWHRWMWRSTVKGPLLLADVPAVVGAGYGLALGAAMAGTALTRLIRAAVQSLSGDQMAVLATQGESRTWWGGVLAAAVWAAGGALVWLWHWIVEGGRRLRTGFSDVVLVLVGIFAAGVAALGGAGTVLFVVLRLLFDRDEAAAPVLSLLDPLPAALAAGTIGWLVWAYHRPLVAARSIAAQQAARLVTAGIALVGAASGVGVIINALLSLVRAPLAGTGARTLLLGGIASLAVGGLVWWFVWKPTHVLSEPLAGQPPGRRIYLVVVFGVSAVAALVTLLVIGFQVFRSWLAGGGGLALIADIRVPLGILVATALAASYHYAVWRHDRAELPAHAARPSIGKAILVTALDPEPFSRAITEATGATVTIWRSVDGLPSKQAPPPAQREAPSTEAVAKALEGIRSRRALVLVGPGDRVEALPLEG